MRWRWEPLLTGIYCNRSSPYVEPSNGLSLRSILNSHCSCASGAAWVEHKISLAPLALNFNAKTSSRVMDARTRVISPWQWPLYTWRTMTAKAHGMQAYGQRTQCVSTERWMNWGIELLATYDLGRVFPDCHDEASVFTYRLIF